MKKTLILILELMMSTLGFYGMALIFKQEISLLSYLYGVIVAFYIEFKLDRWEK